MEVKDFKKQLEQKNGISLNEDYILFCDYEIYCTKENSSVHFKEFDELLDYKIEDKTIREIIEEAENFIPEDNGGRGASSGGNVAGGKLFSGRGGGGRLGVPKKPLPPAYINTLTSPRYKSVEATAKAFGKQYLNAGKEYAGVIDENGFALQHIEGNKASVLHLEKKGAYSIHNHPSKVLNEKEKGKRTYYNAPSNADLRNWALGEGKGTIVVASGNRTVYKVTKSNNFNAKKFVKAMSTARSTGNYDKDVDKWLKANQKALNYKYSKSKF